MTLSTSNSSSGHAPVPLSDLYQEVIMEHSRRPRHKGKPQAGCQYCQDGKNPLCGDQITLFCNVANATEPNAEARLSLAFDGHGCSISQASASMLCEAIQNLPVSRARAVLRHAEDVYTGRARPAQDDLDDDIDALFGVSKFPVRVKCAALPWKTFEIILNEKFDAQGQQKAAEGEPGGGCATLASCSRETRKLRIVSTEG